MSVSDLEQCGCLQWFCREGVLWLSREWRSGLLCVLEKAHNRPFCL